jgi:diguanylate cyclase (GGDEF)-like protein
VEQDRRIAKDRRDRPRAALGWLMTALACAFVAPSTRAEGDPRYPRAAVASSALGVAQSIADVLASPAFAALVRGLGGRQADATEAWIAGNLFSAIGAIVPADREWQRVADFARENRDHERRAAAISQRIDIALAEGDYARCETLARELADIARTNADASRIAFAEANLGIVERRLGHLDRALLHQQRALDLYRTANDRYGTAQSLASLATVHRDRGDFATALDMALESVAIREQTGDRLEIAYRNVALLYREIEDGDAARAYFERAREAAAKTGSPAAYSTVVGAYAGLLNDLGEFAAAEAAAGEALAIDEAIGDRPHQGLEHLELGRALFGQHQDGAASAELESALALGRELGQRETVARSLLHLADIAMQQHDRLRAHGLLDEAIAGLEQARLRPQLAQAYALREQLARADHDDAEALRFAHKYAAEREELLGVRASRQLAALETRHARAEAEQRLALLAKDNELKVALLAKQQLEHRLYLAATIGLAALLLLMAWRFVGVRRLNTALGRRNDEIERQRVALSGANDRLEKQASALYQAAITDSMTGVANRAHSLDQLARSMLACSRDSRELALLLIDFDHFKEINDAHGHLFGDNVLVAGVEAMRRCLRPDELLGRIGGEEFIAIIVDRAPDDVVALAERLRLRVAEKVGERCPELRDAPTVSIGIARLAELDPPPRPEALLEAADKALYAAKSAGRNRVQRYAA